MVRVGEHDQRGTVQNSLDPALTEIERGSDGAAGRAGAAQQQDIARQPDGDAVGLEATLWGSNGRRLLGVIRAYMRHGSRSFCCDRRGG